MRLEGGGGSLSSARVSELNFPYCQYCLLSTTLTSLSMTATTDVQSLLRFLTQDARIPLSSAISRTKALQAASLATPALISASKLPILEPIFDNDAKVARQVLAAAKRVVKHEDGGLAHAEKKRKRTADQPLMPDQPAEEEDIESSLALPHIDAAALLDEIEMTTIVTNRAPLVLAFAVMLLKYTMPLQPLSSRLSLAQAVVSANSRTKAVSLGIEKGKSAEEEGWGKGQPEVKVMGRSVRVLRRWEYQRGNGGVGDVAAIKDDEIKKESDEHDKSTAEESSKQGETSEPALWGLDLEAFKTSNGPQNGGSNVLPIYTPRSARSYLIRSFTGAPSETSSDNIKAEAENGPAKKLKSNKSKAKTVQEEKEHNLALLLGSLDLLYQSWAHLPPVELDRRAWSWYVRVRPDVENGVAGWGGKGKVKLKDILDLRRPS